MANDYAAGAARSGDPGFVARVTVALIVAAGTVAIEDRSQYPDSTMFNLRKTLAVNVLQDPVTWGRRFAWILQYDPRCREDDPALQASDDLLSGVIYWTWNAVAGAGPAITAPPAAPASVAVSFPVSAEAAPAEPVSVYAATVLAGAPAGRPLDVTVEGGDIPIQPRRPVLPPGAELGWPYASPWQEDR